MPRTNTFLHSLPSKVNDVLVDLGRNLKLARKRRGMSLTKVAEKLGLNYRSASEAEKGKPTTGIAVYLALLWAYDLLEEASALANPAKDIKGLRLSAIKELGTPKLDQELDNDF
jgi:transcriptional regulator with XRE-family HTH domain